MFAKCTICFFYYTIVVFSLHSGISVKWQSVIELCVLSGFPKFLPSPKKKLSDESTIGNVEEIEKIQERVEQLKSINLKRFAYLVARAWVELMATTIVKSWAKLLGEAENEIMEKDTTGEEPEDTTRKPFPPTPMDPRVWGCWKFNERTISIK